MNVFVIESPLQYLNAIEAKHYYNLISEKCILVVMKAVQNHNLKQIKYMINEDEWIKIYYIDDVKNSLINLLNKIKKLNDIREASDPIDKIFIGDYRNDLMRHLINSSNYNQAYLLDDGIATISIYKGLYGQTVLKEKNTLKKIIKKYVFGLDVSNIKDIIFFTAYNLPSNNKNKIIKNNHSYLKGKIRSTRKCNEIFILGQPLSEKKIMSEDDYIDHLIKMREYYIDSLNKLIYVTHRSENNEKLHRIENEVGITIRTFNTCIEYELCHGSYAPSELVSFYSSALANCHYIFGNDIKVTSFYINPMLISKSHQKNVKDAYNFLGTEIEVMPL